MSRIVALLLAAGGSRRMGRPKQLIPWQGTPLLRRAARTALASRCDDVLVVLGARADEVGAELADLPVRTCRNPGWQEGIASSIRAGVAALDDDVGAVLVLLADQPRIDAALLDELIAAHQREGSGLAACRYAGRPGVPALFTRPYFEELRGLTGDRGARALLERHPDDCTLLDTPLPVLDVDTPDDLDEA